MFPRTYTTYVGAGLVAIFVLLWRLLPPEFGAACYVLAMGTLVAWLAYAWPEAVVVAYLFSGRFQFDARLAPRDAPISLNQFLAAGMLVLLLVYGNWAWRALRTRSGTATVGFVLALCLGMLWTRGPTYGAEKVVKHLLVVLPSVLAGGGLILARGSLVPMLLAMFLLGLGLDVAALRTVVTGERPYRLSAIGGGPNVFARTVGLSILLGVQGALHFLRKAGRSRFEGILAAGGVVAAGLCVPAFVLAQSRGPTLAMIVAFGLYMLLSTVGDRVRAVASVVVTIALFMLAANFLESTGLPNRFDPEQESNFTSIDERRMRLAQTVDLVLDDPAIGVGTGGWPVAVMGIDFREYPHNWYLEIASEQGLFVGAATFAVQLWVLAAAIATFLRLRPGVARSVLLASITIYLDMLLAIQVTGDVVDNRSIWLLMLMVECAERLALPQLGAGAAPSPSASDSSLPWP
jgi:hypothetical protein